LTNTTIYNITCIGVSGTTPANDSVTVVVNNQTIMSGTLTPYSSSCIITSGNSNCNINFSWNTQNPEATSSVTKNPNITVANGNSGSQSFVIRYNSETFYLYNNGKLLNQSTVSSSCASNTSWDGNKCATATINSPTVNLTADNSNVTYNGSTYLRWNSTNAVSCTANGGTNGWVGTKNTSSSFYTGALTNTTTYNITCTNNSGSAYDSVTVNVDNNNNNQLPTVNLRANPTSINSGNSAYVNWNPTNNPTYCSASGGSNNWTGSRSTYNGNFFTGTLYNTTTYTMTCSNNAGSRTESVTVYVNNNNNQRPTINLTADNSNVTYNGSTYLRWNSNNAVSCTANGGSNGWYGTKNTSGSFYTGALTNTNTYSITCTNNSGSAYDSVTISTTNQPAHIRPSVTVSADNTNLSFNGTTFVRWYTTNAISCTASGGSIGWAGIKSIGPGSFYTGSLSTGKTYTLTCSNNFGSTSDTTRIRVGKQKITPINPKPTPTSLVLITSSINRNQPIVPTIDNTRPKPGDEITYTVNYQNIGTGSITKLTLQLILPQEVSYIFSNPSNPTIFSNLLIFNLGTLKANRQGTVTARVRILNNIPVGTNLNFPATLSYINPGGQPQSVNANVSAQIWSGDEPVNINNNITSLGALAFLFGGNSFFPNTLLGWLLLILIITLLILAIRKAYYGPREVVIPVAENTKDNHSSVKKPKITPH